MVKQCPEISPAARLLALALKKQAQCKFRFYAQSDGQIVQLGIAYREQQVTWSFPLTSEQTVAEAVESLSDTALRFIGSIEEDDCQLTMSTK